MAISFTIPMPPRSKKNSQQILINKKTGRPFIMPSSAYKAYQKGALMLIPGEARQHIDYPVNVSVDRYHARIIVIGQERSDLLHPLHDAL